MATGSAIAAALGLVDLDDVDEVEANNHQQRQRRRRRRKRCRKPQRVCVPGGRRCCGGYACRTVGIPPRGPFCCRDFDEPCPSGDDDECCEDFVCLDGRCV
ncbi:MAG: hypothetical protein ACRDJC_09200 [Thermomicrobiales bacterium]